MLKKGFPDTSVDWSPRWHDWVKTEAALRSRMFVFPHASHYHVPLCSTHSPSGDELLSTRILLVKGECCCGVSKHTRFSSFALWFKSVFPPDDVYQLFFYRDFTVFVRLWCIPLSFSFSGWQRFQRQCHTCRDDGETESSESYSLLYKRECGASFFPISHDYSRECYYRYLR